MLVTDYNNYVHRCRKQGGTGGMSSPPKLADCTNINYVYVQISLQHPH